MARTSCAADAWRRRDPHRGVVLCRAFHSDRARASKKPERRSRHADSDGAAQRGLGSVQIHKAQQIGEPRIRAKWIVLSRRAQRRQRTQLMLRRSVEFFEHLIVVS
jgi:hypothetical protein